MKKSYKITDYSPCDIYYTDEVGRKTYLDTWVAEELLHDRIGAIMRNDGVEVYVSQIRFCDGHQRFVTMDGYRDTETLYSRL